MAELKINNKEVKSLNIGGHDFEDLTIEGKKYSFSKDITVSQADIQSLVQEHTTWETDPSTQVSQVQRLIYVSKEFVEGINPPESSSAGAFRVWNYMDNETIDTDLNDNYESLVVELVAPKVKIIEGTATDRMKWTKISFPNLETCNRNINYWHTLTDVTLPEKFNTPAQLTTLFGPAEDIAKITFRWIDSSGNVVNKGTFAKIDTTIKYQGLDIIYSKSMVLSDKEKIDATVQYDATVSPTLNGGTADVKYTDIEIVNPSRTITQNEVEVYIKINLADTGNLDVTKWPSQYPGTKLYTPNLNIVKGEDRVYTVQADHGFTINGGATVDYTINIPDKVFAIYVGGKNGLKKLVDDALVDVDSHDTWLGFMYQTSDKTIYVGTSYMGLKKLVNDKYVNVDSNNVTSGFMYQTADGTIYVGTSDGGLKKLVGDRYEDFYSTSVEDGFMTQTSDGTIYIGTNDDGLKKFANSKFVDIGSDLVQSGFIYQTLDGTVYVGTYGSGLKKIVNDTLVDIDSANVVRGFMYQTTDGTIYVGTSSNGLKKLVNDKYVDVDSTSVVDGFMTQTDDGTIYVGTYSHGIKKLVNDKYVDVVKPPFAVGFFKEVEV